MRDLQPELLVTGHFEPIAGAERIHAELTRLRDAIQYIHDQTVAGMNAGKDVRTLMREITLARANSKSAKATARSPGMCGRSGRTTRAGFTTGRPPSSIRSGSTPSAPTWSNWPAPTRSSTGRARTWPAGRPLHAIHLAELVIRADPDHPGAAAVLKAAHETLLADSDELLGKRLADQDRSRGYA